MKQQRGQSTVELVLLMPLILVLVFLVFEASRLLGSWLLITNAAREGARYAAVQCVPSNSAGVTQTCSTGQDPTSAIAQQVQQTAQFLTVQTATTCTVSGNSVTIPSSVTSCVAIAYTQDATTGVGVVTVRVAYQVQTLMPIGSLPFFGTVNYPGYQQVTGTSSMRLEQ